MPHAESIVFRFGAFGKTRQAAILAHAAHAALAAGEDFMRIALMAHIPHQFILRRVIHIMQRHRKLHRTQIAGEMAAGFAHRFQQESAQFFGHLRQLVSAEGAQILRQGDGV